MRSPWPTTLGATIVVLVFMAIVFLQLHPDPLPDSNPIKAMMDAQATCSPLPTLELNPKGSTYLMVLHFKHQAPLSSIYKTANATMALKDQCIHPITRDPYIRSIRGGKDNSMEGTDAGGGTTHAFIIEFDSVDHRNYFVDFDPAHKTFNLEVQPLLMQAPIIIDFTTGHY